jgi:uncharacterized phage-associated protein
MADINDVCDYVIVKLCEGGVPLNLLKLHKILYYTQAWSLAFDRGRLFNEEFQAWVHGPVSRQIYDRFRDTKNLYSPVWQQDAPFYNPYGLTDAERAHIDAVLEVYAPYTGDQLEEMTHRELPWMQARGSVPAFERSEATIDDGLMRDFYKARLTQF